MIIPKTISPRFNQSNFLPHHRQALPFTLGTYSSGKSITVSLDFRDFINRPDIEHFPRGVLRTCSIQDKLLYRGPQIGKVLLIVEDEFQAQLEGGALERKGYNVTAVLSGEIGLKLLRDEHFDVIVINRQLRGLSGPEVALEIKKMFSTSKKPPIVLVTGDPLSTNPEGVDVTTFKSHRFLNLLPDVVHQASQTGIGERQRMQQVLVCEPSLIVRTMVDGIIKATGHGAVDTREKPEALDKIQNSQPGLVITNLVPDGLDIAREVKKINPKLPVVVFTSSPEQVPRDLKLVDAVVEKGKAPPLASSIRSLLPLWTC